MYRCFLAVLTCIFIGLPGQGLTQDYIIGEGDGLAISVWGEDALSTSGTVRPDGKLSITGLGDVTVSGLTPMQLKEVLEKELTKLVHNPMVTVSVDNITNNRVFVFGGGAASGVHDLLRRTTLLQLLTTLGDLNAADLRSSYLLRNDQKIKQGFYELWHHGDLTNDVILQPGDMLFIPQVTNRMVYVLGGVQAPLPIEYREGITVMEAILLSGGFTEFARENATKILRQVDGAQETIPVRVKDLRGGDLTQNIVLHPGDYVIVPEGLF